MSNIPRELDWVGVRAACSVQKIFKELTAGVEDDVKAINAVPLPWPNQNSIQCSPNRDGTLFVVGRGNAIKGLVKFHLGTDRIEIVDEASDQTLVVTLTVNDEGRCKLKVGTEELEQWQVRRRALERLFFHPAI